MASLVATLESLYSVLKFKEGTYTKYNRAFFCANNYFVKQVDNQGSEQVQDGRPAVDPGRTYLHQSPPPLHPPLLEP